MKILTALTLTTCGLFFTTSAFAQTEPVVEKKIYRWVDKNGKVQISDQLPPDAVDNERKEYNANTGTLKTVVKTQLTPAQRVEAEKQAKIEALARIETETAKRIEQGLLINYETEKDLLRSFDERTDLLKQTIISLKASIQSRRAALITALNQLSDLELKGQTIPEIKINELKQNHELILSQSAHLERLNGNFTTIKKEFDITLSKYRELKSVNSVD